MYDGALILLALALVAIAAMFLRIGRLAARVAALEAKLAPLDDATTAETVPADADPNWKRQTL